MSFLAAAAFQWISPKAWAMTLTAVTVYAPTQTQIGLAAVAAIFGLVKFPSVEIWAVLGQPRRALTDTGRMKVSTLNMATLLVASLYPVLSH